MKEMPYRMNLFRFDRDWKEHF